MMFVHLCQEGVYERWREWICWENIRKELPLVTALKVCMERAMGVEPTSKAWEVAVQLLEGDMPARRESLKPLLHKRFKDFSF